MLTKTLRKFGIPLMVSVLIAGMLAGCSSGSAKTNTPASTTGGINQKSTANEEYVWISCDSSLPMFVDNDQAGLKQFGKDYGVKVEVVGPTDADTSACANTIDEVIAQKPAGIMIIGWDESLKNAVNKAVASGIPTVLVDSDLSDTNRACFVGTDWHNVGVAHAEQMVKYTKGKGKVAVEMILGAQNMNDALNGYKSVLAKYPQMQLVSTLDTKGDVSQATQDTSNLISAYPDLAGISNFDGSTPGVGPAIKSANKVGKIVCTGMNVDAPQIKLLQDGVFNALVGQKRALFTYYAGVVLYSMNHTNVKVTANDKAMGIDNVPQSIDTGLFVVDKNNVKDFAGK